MAQVRKKSKTKAQQPNNDYNKFAEKMPWLHNPLTLLLSDFKVRFIYLNQEKYARVDELVAKQIVISALLSLHL